MTTTTNTLQTNSALEAIRARALELANRPTKATSRKTPKQCACQCGGWTKGGTWLPGHDAKALSAMLAEIRNPKPAVQDADVDTQVADTDGMANAA